VRKFRSAGVNKKEEVKFTKFEEITAWQKARVLTSDVYTITRQKPFCQDYGLVDQIRRASGSIMHNIAEGFDAGSNKEFVRFLRYSFRSASEVQSQLYIALDASYIDQSEFELLYEQSTEIKKIIAGLIKYLLSQQ
jgi:four helix bundle protein|tara:strand:+ start:130 stop:537 length:408 start_codon:yes stop_codon:yes gene_type:complete